MGYPGKQVILGRSSFAAGADQEEVMAGVLLTSHGWAASPSMEGILGSASLCPLQ